MRLTRGKRWISQRRGDPHGEGSDGRHEGSRGWSCQQSGKISIDFLVIERDFLLVRNTVTTMFIPGAARGRCPERRPNDDRSDGRRQERSPLSVSRAQL